jgi:long-chain acyl-CoA synthetase
VSADDPLLAAWAKTLTRKGGSRALFDVQSGAAQTFGEVELRARFFETETPLRDFAAGEIVAIQIGNDPDWPALFLACRRRGLVVLPLERSMADQERDAALAVCQVAGLIVSTEPALIVAPVAGVQKNNWDTRPPALLKLTSGTTAAPRAIRFRSAQLIADAEQVCDTMGISEHDLNFGVIPVSHSYGWSNLITPLLVRGVPLALSRDRMPRAILDDLARTGATVFPGMPVFFQAFCEMIEAPALPKLRLCISAGAPLTTQIAARFAEKFALSIHTFYGASECGGICFNRDATGMDRGLVGKPMHGVSLELLGPENEASPMRVRSAAAGDDYFPTADRAKLGAGFFIPDDLASMSADGVRLRGRVSDVINVAGKKVSPAEVEAHLLRFDGVREAVVFGRDSARRHQEVAACVIAEACVTEADLLEFCRRHLSGWQVPRRIFLVDEIPVNERGKINRRALALRFGPPDAPEKSQPDALSRAVVSESN